MFNKKDLLQKEILKRDKNVSFNKKKTTDVKKINICLTYVTQVDFQLTWDVAKDSKNLCLQ